jgi:hypothetical protein
MPMKSESEDGELTTSFNNKQSYGSVQHTHCCTQQLHVSYEVGNHQVRKTVCIKEVKKKLMCNVSPDLSFSEILHSCYRAS